MKTPGKKNQKGHEEWKRALKFVYIDKETWVGLIDISGVFFFFSPRHIMQEIILVACWTIYPGLERK